VSKIPNLLYADSNGEINSHPYLKMAVRSGVYDMVPYEVELIPLPPASRLYFLPDTNPIAYDENSAGMTTCDKGSAVAVFLPPAYLRLFLPSYKKLKDYTMPLFAYTAVGEIDGELVVPAIKVDDDSRWNPDLYDFSTDFDAKIDLFLKTAPKNNRLYDQLKQCASTYHCTASKNVFYPRWECPIPTSPICNANCIGCISFQQDDNCKSSQDRVAFIPTVDEIVTLALHHNEFATDPIISFGQGCEGDPILQADIISEAVKIIKQSAPNLTINFNSNCSIPKNIEKLVDAGVDSFRVSLNSFVENTYNSYYRPKTYTLDDVKTSMDIIKTAKRYLQINLLTFPGINDRKSETDTLIEAVIKYNVNLIQTRNLNIDAELLLSNLNPKPEELYGIVNMLRKIKKASPETLFGYFNRIKSDFYVDRSLPDLKVKKNVT